MHTKGNGRCGVCVSVWYGGTGGKKMVCGVCLWCVCEVGRYGVCLFVVCDECGLCLCRMLGCVSR
jgi:hypothetical protein